MKALFNRIFGSKPGELLLIDVVNDCLVTVVRFPRQSLDSVQFNLDGESVALVGSKISDPKGRYEGSSIVARQFGGAVVVMLVCPNKKTVNEFCCAYPKGAPQLSITVRKRTSRAGEQVVPFDGGIGTALLWPTFPS